MNSKMNQDEDLIYNTAKRIPICICVDTGAKSSDISNSMYGVDNVSKILENIEVGIKEMHKVMNKSDMVKDGAEVAVVSFNKDIDLLQNFTPVSRFENVSIPVKINTDESTNLGAGVLCGLDMFQKRKQIYGAHGVDYHTPWLILITSEKSMSKELKQNVEIAKKQTLLLEKQNKLVVITVYVESNDTIEFDPQFMKVNKKQKSYHVEFSKGNGFQIVGRDKLIGFFEWLGKSINSKAFDNIIKLDFSGLIDWEDI